MYNRGSNSSEGTKFSLLHTHPDRSWGPPSILYVLLELLPEAKRPGRGVDHPAPSSTKVKNGYSYIYTPPFYVFMEYYAVTFT